MRELSTISRTIQTEEGRRLTLQYVVLVETMPGGQEKFGVKITENESTASAIAPGLTESLHKIYDLIGLLAEHTVTPTSLIDVLTDRL